MQSTSIGGIHVLSIISFTLALFIFVPGESSALSISDGCYAGTFIRVSPAYDNAHTALAPPHWSYFLPRLTIAWHANAVSEYQDHESTNTQSSVQVANPLWLLHHSKFTNSWELRLMWDFAALVQAPVNQKNVLLESSAVQSFIRIREHHCRQKYHHQRASADSVSVASNWKHVLEAQRLIAIDRVLAHHTVFQ